MKNTFIFHAGQAVPLDRDNIDTDQIIPARFLKAIERKDRLEKFKRLLNDVKIPFEQGDWQTIDRDCERNKLN